MARTTRARQVDGREGRIPVEGMQQKVSSSPPCSTSPLLTSTSPLRARSAERRRLATSSGSRRSRAQPSFLHAPDGARRANSATRSASWRGPSASSRIARGRQGASPDARNAYRVEIAREGAPRRALTTGPSMVVTRLRRGQWLRTWSSSGTRAASCCGSCRRRREIVRFERSVPRCTRSRRPRAPSRRGPCDGRPRC